MHMKQDTSFAGFRPEAFQFLANISENNNKIWFEKNREVYERYILEPFRHLVIALNDLMLSIDPHLEVRPSVNRTISRIYRDTRFSADKSLYRSNMWIVFKRPIKSWKDVPAFFFEIFPDWYRYGMGFYALSRLIGDRFREKIITDPEAFRKTISHFYQKGFLELHGEKYKKRIGPDNMEDIDDWYQRRNIYVAHVSTIDNRLLSKNLLDDLKTSFEILSPLYHFFCEIIP